MPLEKFAFTVRGDEWARFVGQPALAELASTVLDGPVQLLPRTILRHFDRSTPRASRAHTDLSYLDRGSADLLTIWIPIGDCPAETGSLVYLEGSHRLPASQFDQLRQHTDRNFSEHFRHPGQFRETLARHPRDSRL